MKKMYYDKFKNKPLTKKEIRILKLICKELTNEQIAKRLKLSTRTIEGARDRLSIKIKAKNVVGLVIYAIKNQIVTLD